MPIERRTSAGRASRSYPATVAVPLSGRDSVVRIRTVVDFPAPFGPSRPKIVPVGTLRLTPRRACTRSSPRRRPGYVLTRSTALIASSAADAPGAAPTTGAAGVSRPIGMVWRPSGTG
jgi:hypothetical protein